MKMINKSLKTKLTLSTILISVLALSACSQQTKPDGSGGSVKSGQDNASSTTGTTGTTGTVGVGNASGVDSNSTRGDYLPSNNNANNDPNNTNDLTLAGLNDPNNLLSKRVIYFDYNQASIRAEYMVLINTHAQLAAKFPQLRMRLEGHADERGSREYNVALSEQRAQSVKRIMGTQGARSGQIKTIGYGEEVPLVKGHNKNSWEQNRRVEIKYENY
jgi:peptidoglycan-associated lipoprotein